MAVQEGQFIGFNKQKRNSLHIYYSEATSVKRFKVYWSTIGNAYSIYAYRHSVVVFSGTGMQHSKYNLN